MKIDEYKKISDNVQVPDVVWEGYQNAIKQIKMEKETDKNIVKISKWKNVNALAKIAVVFGAVVLLSGGTFLSVKAYISHLEKIRNMEAEEVIDLYENIFQYDSKYMSRSMSADEERRFSELYDLYCRDINYSSANTETSFYNRELSFDELGRRKVLKMLYKSGEKQPENTMPIIQKESEYSGEDIAFCVNNCTFYFPNDELSDEQLLELIDFQIKVDYCRQRIEDEIERGIRSDWPYIEYVERERIITLDSDVKVDDEILSQQWLKAYEDILREYYRENSTYYENPERYYANVCFIYLNDDEIPEMLFSHGCTDLDYDDRCNLQNYLYTYKNGEAVLLTPGAETIDDFYGYNKPFSYVERKGMVYCDYYYIYDFTTYNSETDMIDNVNDHMSKMDVWDLDTLTCTSSNANIEMLHAIYNYVEEEYADATFNVEYYVNVSDIIRDENTGYVKEIIGEKVDRQTYEKSEASLWSGEQITTLSISDYDKIYADDNLLEALAQCYLKNRM